MWRVGVGEASFPRVKAIVKPHTYDGILRDDVGKVIVGRLIRPGPGVPILFGMLLGVPDVRPVGRDPVQETMAGLDGEPGLLQVVDLEPDLAAKVQELVSNGVEFRAPCGLRAHLLQGLHTLAVVLGQEELERLDTGVVLALRAFGLPDLRFVSLSPRYGLEVAVAEDQTRPVPTLLSRYFFRFRESF
jgi:hypothetical protein